MNNRFTAWSFIKDFLINEGFTLKVMFTAILAFIFPMLPYIALVVALVFIDFISAIVQAKQLGITITSRKMRDTGWKLIGYILIIFCFKILDELIPIIDWLPIICGYIAIVEAYSIGENLAYSSKVNFVKAILRYVFKKISSEESETLSKVFQEVELERAETLNKESSKLHKRLISRSISLHFKDTVRDSPEATAEKISAMGNKKGGYVALKNKEGKETVITKVLESNDNYQIYQSYFKPNVPHTEDSGMDYLYYFYVKSGNITVKQKGAKINVKEGSFYSGKSLPTTSFISEDGAVLIYMATKDAANFIEINSYLFNELI